MSRYNITNKLGDWSFGWDQPMLTFYLQLYKDGVPEDDNPVIWLGTHLMEIYEVGDLCTKARLNGLNISYDLQVKLYGDKDLGR